MSRSRTRTAFLNCFADDLRGHVVEFARRLSSTDADVFVALARKAACFLDAMEDLGLLKLDGLLTSDRVLAADTRWLAGRRVAIIDDALISGSTLRRVKNELADAGASVSSIQVLCVDQETWRPRLVVPDTPYLQLSSRRTTSLCASILEAISLLPRPYAVDFPIFQDVRVDAGDIDRLGTMPGWLSYDLTTPLQAANDVRVWSMVPAPSLRRQFSQEIGINLSDVAPIQKIRLFARRERAPGRAWLCRVVPMLVLDPLPTPEINHLWLDLPALGCPGLSLSYKDEARLSVVQYLLSARLFAFWNRAFSQWADRSTNATLRRRDLSFLFPPDVHESIQAVCLSDEPFPKRTLRTVRVPALSDCKLGTQAAETLSPQQKLARLTKPFLERFQTVELQARRAAKELGERAFTDEPATMNRLREGFSLPELREWIGDGAGEAGVSTVIDWFVDRAIDCGIIVPITVERDGVVYRAYRHGEDVQWGEVESFLASVLLYRFAKSRNGTPLPRTWTEKLLVLLVQRGSERGFLRQWTSTALGFGRIVGVRYYLHGAVARSGPNPGAVHGAGEPLAQLLADEGRLEAVPTARGEGWVPHLYPVQLPPVTEHAQRLAEQWGTLIGDLSELPLGDARRVTLEDVTLLVTCATRRGVTEAIAAELDIIQRGSGTFARWMRARGIINAREAIAGLRSSRIFTALNSGVWKEASGRAQAAQAVYRRVHQALVASDAPADQYRVFVWSELFAYADVEPAARPDSDTETALRAVSGALTRWRVMVYMLLTLLSQEAEAALPPADVAAGEAALNQLSSPSSTPDEQSFASRARGALGSSHEGRTRLERLARWLDYELGSLGRHTAMLVDRIEYRASSTRGEPSITSYQHVAVVRTRGGGADSVRARVHNETLVRRPSQGPGARRGEPVVEMLMAPGVADDVILVGSRSADALSALVELTKSLLTGHSSDDVTEIILLAKLTDEQQPFRSGLNSPIQGRGFADLVGSLLAGPQSPTAVVRLLAPKGAPKIVRTISQQLGKSFLPSKAVPAGLSPLGFNTGQTITTYDRAPVHETGISLSSPEPAQASETQLNLFRHDNLAVMPGRLALVNTKMNVLAVATEWSSGNGGLSTLNRALCKALAAVGVEVVCVTVDPSSDEIADAARSRVRLIPAAEQYGIEGRARLSLVPRLPEGFVPEVILGHSRVTGVEARVLSNSFPSSVRAHFIHMAPDEIEWWKDGRDDDTGTRAEVRTDLELSLGRSAFRVFAIGPRLFDRFRTDFVPWEVPVVRLDPGFDVADKRPRTPPPGKPLRVLVVGRLEDASLKGVDFAAQAIGRAVRLRGEGAAPVELVLRGAPAGESAALRTKTESWAAAKGLSVVVRPYSSDPQRMRDDLRRASLVLMPSRTEGFGLVGLEAIVEGTPVLVSGESGLAELLTQELNADDVRRVVLPVNNEQDTLERWTAAIERVLVDREAAFITAERVRARMADRRNWEYAARVFVAEFQEIVRTSTSEPSPRR